MIKQAINSPVSVVGQVTKRIETAGPIIFQINDGQSIITAKLFKGNADHIQQGDFVTVAGTVSIYQGEKEISISSIVKSDTAKGAMEKKITGLAAPATEKLAAKSEYLQKLLPEMQKAAGLIRKAVFSGRPILVRHHSDVDGFSGGLQIEKAIQQIAPDKYRLRRSTMRAPFYEMDDILRDISMSEADISRWREEPPLVVILDNGSSTQDVDALFLGREHGMDFIVIDHHVFGERDAITPITLAHVNQLRVGEYETCTGFLAFEIARMISADYEEFHDIPAMAGISDRVDDDVQEFHLSKSKANKDLLTKFEKVLTWLLGQQPYMDNTAFLQKLFWSTQEYKQKLVNQYYPQLEEKSKTALEVLNLSKEAHDVNGVNVVFVPLSVLPRRSYPKAGMASGLLFDKEKESNKATLVIGLMDDGFVIRAAPETKVDVHSIIKYLDDKLPYPVYGGGHKVAGSAKLAKAITSEEELKKVKQLVMDHVSNP
ncbi:MAG: OB-fold nucleic acid binding domain-containing protein [Candidatus Nanoarchaeia archaeon]